MRVWFVRAAAVIAAAAAFVSAPQLTHAQAAPVNALEKGLIGPADSMLQQALASKKAEHNARRADPNSVAAAAAKPAAPQFADNLETPKPGILYPNSPGIHITADVSSAFAEGNIGYKKNNLPMGQDVAIFIGPDPDTRLLVGYYTVQQYPVGFDQGLIPTYIQSAALPGGSILVPRFGPRISCANPLVTQTALQTGNPVPPALCGNLPGSIGQSNENLVQADAEVDQKVMIAALSRLIWFGFGLPGLGGGGYLPVVITPNYVATKSYIAGHDDVYLAYDPAHGTYQSVHLRSSEQKGFLLTIPFADSSKLFMTYNIGPQWLVNTNGYNQSNSAQLFQYMDIRYFATHRDTLFFQPSRLPAYYPTDAYAEHLVTYIYGFNHSFAKGLFLQGLVTSGYPQNPQYGHSGRIGAIDATCIKYPDCINLQKVDFQRNTAITYGGERATTFLLQFGVGTPSAVPL